MNNKETWVKDVMNSTEGMQRATPSNDLFDKIYARLPKNNIVPIKTLSWAAVAACLLIAMNVFSITIHVDQQEMQKTTSMYETDLFTDYTLYN